MWQTTEYALLAFCVEKATISSSRMEAVGLTNSQTPPFLTAAQTAIWVGLFSRSVVFNPQYH